MLNQAKEELNKLIQRLEMLFQIQTHEVVQDLKKIRELLNNQEDVEAPKQPKAKKEEIKQEHKQEIVEDIEAKQQEEIETAESIHKTETTDTIDIEKEAKQYLKDNGVSNRKFLKGQKAIDKAIELGFSI